jgi:hypothetical protein
MNSCPGSFGWQFDLLPWGVLRPLSREERLSLARRLFSDPDHVRGTRVLPAEVVREMIDFGGEPAMDLGFIPPLPARAQKQVSLIMGDSGTGKTLFLQLVIAWVIDLVNRGLARLVLFDQKGSLAGFAAGLAAPHVPFRQMNVLLEGATAFDIQGTFPGMAGAEAAAHVLVPDSQSNQRFFDDASRIVAAGATDTLGRGGAAFDLADLVGLTLASKHLMRALKRNRHTRPIVEQILRRARSAGDVFSTLATHLGRFQVAAALSAQCAESVSVPTLVEETGVTVLGGDSEYGKPLSAIYRLLLTALVNALLARRGRQGLTFIVADEFHMVGEISALLDTIAMGREAGICVWLASVGKEVVEFHLGRTAAGVLNMPQTFFSFGTSSPETARFFSDRYGSAEIWDYTHSYSATSGWSRGVSTDRHGEKTRTSSASGSVTSGFSRTRKERPIVSVGEFLSVPAAAPEAGDFRFCARSPYWPAAFHCRTDLLSRVKALSAPVVPEAERVDVSTVRLSPFTARRGRELGLW